MSNRHFVVVHTPGPAWEPGLPLTQQVGILEHRNHWARALEDGWLQMGGPFTDGAGGGMMVCRPDVDEDMLRAHALADPAVESDLLQFEIRSWSIALAG